VTCYYFYLWDDDFGPASIKLCAYFPTRERCGSTDTSGPNGQAVKAGIGFTELSNGFAACDDPQALQAICDRLDAGTINVFGRRWLAQLPLPLPLTEADRRAGYWWEASLRQVEVSRTIVFDAPQHARGFFEALIADNLVSPARVRRRSLGPGRSGCFREGRVGQHGR
jgi:hypothetical protein